MQRHTLLFAGNPQPLSESAPDLPCAEAEAQTLHRIARRHGHPTTHICHLARNTVIKSRLVQALELARYAHLALHGSYNAEQPRASRLLLAAQDLKEDSYITLGEILDGALDLKGLRLLVLSACETSTIDMRHTPDEVLGLAAGFQKAGVATIIASLWAIDDEATYLLMSRFAQLYLDPQNLWTPVQALAEAQHWLRTEATNKVLEEYDPLPTHAILRSARHTYAHMKMTIRIKASRSDPDVLPYCDAFYWAGFVAIGC